MSSSYMRESLRHESSLPYINRTHEIRRSGRGVATLEDLETEARYTRDDGAIFYPRPPSPGHLVKTTAWKHSVENQEQMRSYKDQLEEKDRLIAQLTSLSTTPRPRYDTSRIDEVFTADRMQATATAKSEVAGLSVRVEGLQAQLREAQVQLDVREERIRELKRENEMSRENEAKHLAAVTSLKTRLAEYDAQVGSFEGAATRSEVAIQTLSRSNREAQEKIVELESRIRTHLEDREHSHQQLSMNEKKFREIITSFRSIISLEDMDGFDLESPEILVAKMKDIVQENAMLKGKLYTMKEYVQSAEIESKASRETITRLVNEAEREQKSVNRYTLDMENLRVERDNACGVKGELLREIDSLKERLESCQRAWSATKNELQQVEHHYKAFDNDMKNHELAARDAHIQLKTFKEQLASMLCDAEIRVDPVEEQIRERIRMLMAVHKDKSVHVEMLQSKVDEVTHQLETQFELSRSGDRRAKRLESDYLELEERLRKAENELCAGDVLRDGLRNDKERYMRFLERISRALNMDAMAADVGVEMALEGILVRCEQLIRMEADNVIDKKTHIYNLQRKIKSMKEQLESKDLHMDLLRKKVGTLEERYAGSGELEREKDSEMIKARKLVKLVEKYKRELQETRFEVRDLKARLLESTEFRSRAVEQDTEIDKLESKVGQLEHVRQKQARKIAGLKEEVDVTSQELGQKRANAETVIQNLTRELRTTKNALDEITKRERQLLDLRQVIARMLGLDINTLAVPDYEIIARLEKLILAQQSSTVTSLAIDSALNSMEDGFVQGYHNPSKIITMTKDRARSPAKRLVRTRTRSASPTKRDNRAY